MLGSPDVLGWAGIGTEGWPAPCGGERSSVLVVGHRVCEGAADADADPKRW